jgi:hypothetical protein
MDLLREQYPDFYRHVISSENIVPDMQIEETAQPGNYLVKSGGARCHLHSAYDIDREMEALFRPLSGEDSQVIVIFGLGYGHCLDYIRKKRIKYKRVVIFEPCSNILAEVLKKRQILEILGRKDVYLHLLRLPNDMAAYLLEEALESKTVKMLYHISYMTLFKKVYDEVLRIFRNEKTSTVTSVNTFSYFSGEWNRHQLKALRRDAANGLRLEGKFRGAPGIIASAGPSLAKQFDLLRQVGDRAVVVAPGSSARILNARGVNAHIGMAIDSQAAEVGYFKNYQLKSALVGSYRIHPQLYDVFPNDIVRVALTTEFLALYHCEWAGEAPLIIGDHASVASAALELLFRLGCDPIVLVGQDLCYYDNKIYADDSGQKPISGNYAQMQEDIDIHGDKVLTYYGFKAMQNDMEILGIKYGGRVRLLNATEAGLYIKGIQNVAFADVFEKYVEPSGADVSAILRMALAKERRGGSGGGFGEGGKGGKGGKGAGSGSGGAGGDGAKDAKAFYSLVMKECESVEEVIAEKERGFARYDKLKSRGVGKNRLGSEMGYISGFNRKLDEIPFFGKVVFRSIEQQLTYYRAGAGHLKDSDAGHLGKELYERKLDELSLDFVGRLKLMAGEELKACQEDGKEG